MSRVKEFASTKDAEAFIKENILTMPYIVEEVASYLLLSSDPSSEWDRYLVSVVNSARESVGGTKEFSKIASEFVDKLNMVSNYVKDINGLDCIVFVAKPATDGNRAFGGIKLIFGGGRLLIDGAVSVAVPVKVEGY